MGGELTDRWRFIAQGVPWQTLILSFYQLPWCAHVPRACVGALIIIAMYLRAGVFSLVLLMVSRLLGLARESVQAAAFGASGLGDVAIVMFTLPDVLVGVFLSGALSYVLLPLWAGQTVAQQSASQSRLAKWLLLGGVLAGAALWQARGTLSRALAPGLTGDMQALSAASLSWSAAVLPLAMLAALWATRLQHARDFVGMYAGSLWVNALLLIALLLVAFKAFKTPALDALGVMHVLGVFLLLAMLVRLAWLGWRLPRVSSGLKMQAVDASGAGLPPAKVWFWAALSSGLLLLLPLMARSLASQAGEGALATFNYAWKLIELPLVLAVQLVASVAFAAITHTAPGTPERQQALQTAFGVAWALACAAAAVVAMFSMPLATALFGWGRMGPTALQIIADWAAVGVWSLLPQALMAVLLTVMALSRRMHVAVGVYAAGLAALLVWGLFGGNIYENNSSLGMQNAGSGVMFALNVVLTCMAAALLVTERAQLKNALLWRSLALPLAVSVAVVQLKPWVAGWGVWPSAAAAAACGLLVVGSGLAAHPLLRAWLSARWPPLAGQTRRTKPKAPTASD